MRFILKTALAFASCLAITLAGCSKDDGPGGDENNSNPDGGYGTLNGNLITIGSTRDITYTGCVLLGTVDFPKITSDHTYGIVFMEALQDTEFDYDGKLIYGGHSGKTDKEEYDCISASISSSTSEGKFEKQLVNLKPNTKYYYRAYVSIGQNTNYSNVEYFTTLDPSPEISMSTQDASDLYAVKGRMNGVVMVGNLQDVNEDQKYGFVYTDEARMNSAETLTYEYYETWIMSHFETEDDMDSPDEVTTTSNLNGRINVDVTGLKPGTTYYYRSFFKWNGKYFYSPEVKTLTTKGTNEISVGTNKATDVTGSSATLNASVPFSMIGLDDVNAGFMISKVYSNASEFNRQDARKWSERYAYPNADVYYIDQVISDKDFSCGISGLSPQTTYYYCGYIDLGEYDEEELYLRGNIQSFQTEAAGNGPNGSSIEFSSSGSYPWTQTGNVWYSGNRYVNSSSSDLRVTVFHQPGDVLHLKINVSSESSYDGVEIYNSAGSKIRYLISGIDVTDEFDLDMNDYTYSNGQYQSIFIIRYKKNVSNYQGTDQAWIDVNDVYVK